MSEVKVVKIGSGFRVLNRQYDRYNNLKVNLFVFGGRSVPRPENSGIIILENAISSV